MSIPVTIFVIRLISQVYYEKHLHNMVAQRSAVRLIYHIFNTQYCFHIKTLSYSTLPSMKPLATAITFYHKLTNIIWLATQTIGFLR